ncbi:MAG: glycosyltransferase [Chloroflexota bacterium]|nr:glycosyltransferase [Chloroflexota bacterium]
MRIVLLVPAFPPKWVAGTEIATYKIASHLAKRGHEVHVITQWDRGLPKESLEEGFHVHRARFVKVRFLGIMLFWQGLWHAIRRTRPDVVHAQSLAIGVPALLAKKLLRKPYVIWCQGSDIYLPSFSQRLVTKVVLRNADAVIALTRDMDMQIQKICSRKTFIIPNGIDMDTFEISAGRNNQSISRCEGKTIIYIGTFRPVKGVSYLVHAMDIIRRKEPGARLILVGDGEERLSLENLVRSLHLETHVSFEGRVSNEKVPELMENATIFVLPSLSEGFPVVSLEAMASGLPVIASNVRGLPEIIDDGENGFLV